MNYHILSLYEYIQHNLHSFLVEQVGHLDIKMDKFVTKLNNHEKLMYGCYAMKIWQVVLEFMMLMNQKPADTPTVCATLLVLFSSLPSKMEIFSSSSSLNQMHVILRTLNRSQKYSKNSLIT